MPSSPVSLRLARCIAGGFGTGRAPCAPGTAASAAATIVGAGLSAIWPRLLIPAVLLALAGGFWAIRKLAPADDPGWVVIDEIAGQWITLLALPQPSLPTLLAGFLLFRAFDILKPGPVRWVERWPGALGVIADDVVAGALAALVLLVGQMVYRALVPHA